MILAICLVLGVIAAAIAYAIYRAPLGWEDEATGFHFGAPHMPDTGREGTDFKAAYDAGAQRTDALSFTLDPSFHATGVVE